MTNQMISAQGLTKTFPAKGKVVEAVRSVDLEVDAGELVAFLGPNGAGKSTTLRMLTTLLPPTSGEAIVAGSDIRRDPAGVRRRIGYVGQGNSGGHTQRVRDELHAQGAFYGMGRRETRARAAELIESLELGQVAGRQVQSLSGGQKRRLDIALGLIHRPELLFLDEPSTGLDPHSRANLWEHIGALRERYGMTIVLTTHYLDEADSMAERVVVIDHGTIVADAPPAALKRDHADDVVTLVVTGTPGSQGQVPDDVTRVRAALAPVVGDVGGGERSGSRAAGGPGATGGADDATVQATVGAGGDVTVTLSTTHGADRLPEAIESLRVAGFAVRSAGLKQASLDDVFLNLTGRSLREEAA